MLEPPRVEVANRIGDALTTGETLRSERRRKWLKRYGLTNDSYAEILAAQDGRCAICRTGQNAFSSRSFAVDHCHQTGAIRGLLCWHCNAAIGHLRDSPEHAMAAAAYLSATAGGTRWGVVPARYFEPREPVLTRLTEDERQRIILLWREGKSQGEIAQAVSRGRSSVAVVLKRAGLPRRRLEHRTLRVWKTKAERRLALEKSRKETLPAVVQLIGEIARARVAKRAQR